MKKKAIKNLRQSLGLTQEGFARELGVSRGAVAKWEAGDFQPSPLALMQIERLKNQMIEEQRKEVEGHQEKERSEQKGRKGKSPRIAGQLIREAL